jgi:Fe2+ or Zn2+ uptake regulation protein
MTKQEVLEIFVKEGHAITPDSICRQLRGFHHRSSVYSYLFRLHKQGLLLRGLVHGRIAYQISQRGIERLNFFRSRLEIAPIAAREPSGIVAIGESGRK